MKFKLQVRLIKPLSCNSNFITRSTSSVMWKQLTYILALLLTTAYAIQLDPEIQDISTLVAKQSDQLSSLNFDDVIQIQESVPVKDSLTYGSILGYKFKPSLEVDITHSYQIIIFLSGSICRLPDNWNTNTSMNGILLHYTFNETVADNLLYDEMESVEFENGFLSVLIEQMVYDSTLDYMLYMVISLNDCDDCTADSTWVFEFAASQKNIMFMYDNNPRISVVDVDYDSAIFETERNIFAENRTYEMYIFSNLSSIPTALNQSLCAITENTEYERIVPINESIVRGLENSFMLTDFEVAKSYQAILTVTYPNIPYAGGVFQPFGFTMSKTKSCKLVFGLDFCDEVAYAAPISDALLYGHESWGSFMASYDNYTESLYEPFLFALQQVACDTELDARYSPMRTCDDCRYSYKQWLCAVNIPRCVSSLNSGAYNKDYSAGSGRNHFIESTIKSPLPYAEVLPCLNVCQAIVRDCPADFGFGCPETKSLVELSYIDPTLLDDDDKDLADMVDTDSTNTYLMCNYLGERNLDISSTAS